MSANNDSGPENSLLTHAGDCSLTYQLRRSERAKKTRIIVAAGKIEVVAPMKVSERRIRAFVEAQHDWIRDAIKRVGHRAQAVNSLAPPQYMPGALVPYQGRRIELAIKPTSAKSHRVQLLAQDQILVYQPNSTLPEHGSDSIRLALEGWMKHQARQHALQMIDRHSQKHQLLPRSLRIKTQKSRWGSCGPRNDINLNWLLMLAPPVIMEYVVVHELCHIKQKNHSRDFWALVSEHMPDYLQHRHWLKQHGASLMRGL